MTVFSDHETRLNRQRRNAMLQRHHAHRVRIASMFNGADLHTYLEIMKWIAEGDEWIKHRKEK